MLKLLVYVVILCSYHNVCISSKKFNNLYTKKRRVIKKYNEIKHYTDDNVVFYKVMTKNPEIFGNSKPYLKLITWISNEITTGDIILKNMRADLSICLEQYKILRDLYFTEIITSIITILCCGFILLI